MEPADSIGHVDEAGFADAYDDEGDSFLPPQRDLDRMKLGNRLDVVVWRCWHGLAVSLSIPAFFASLPCSLWRFV
jgi:hypothetical protein